MEFLQSTLLRYFLGDAKFNAPVAVDMLELSVKCSLNWVTPVAARLSSLYYHFILLYQKFKNQLLIKFQLLKKLHSLYVDLWIIIFKLGNISSNFFPIFFYIFLSCMHWLYFCDIHQVVHYVGDHFTYGNLWPAIKLAIYFT